MNINNFVLFTDSYKLSHWNQYPEDTEGVYSYFESRPGAKYPYTVFFGLQYILKNYLEGEVVASEDVEEAYDLAKAHFGNAGLFNYDGWMYIVDQHNGRLPLQIKAVPEGSPIPTGNVLMTVENTDPNCYWLTNAVESLLTHVWYPSTVATLSRRVKETIASFLPDDKAGLEFMLHDFGYRGVSSHESAEIGGLAHLVNFVGTDTLPALLLGVKCYDADTASLGFSVPATEHSVMTSLGKEGEFKVVDSLLEKHPAGILSVVADSYNIYDFVGAVCGRFKERILARDGVFVVRPDSITEQDPTPEKLVLSILNKLWDSYGGNFNNGQMVLDPHVRVIWGDGIDEEGIAKILVVAYNNGFCVSNLVFGMGGGLLQKVNRDVQRFAFKCSAQKRNEEWADIFKDPLDSSKASKKGRLKLIKPTPYQYATVQENGNPKDDLLRTVFKNGELQNEITFDQVRQNAKL